MKTMYQLGLITAINVVNSLDGKSKKKLILQTEKTVQTIVILMTVSLKDGYSIPSFSKSMSKKAIGKAKKQQKSVFLHFSHTAPINHKTSLIQLKNNLWNEEIERRRPYSSIGTFDKQRPRHNPRAADNYLGGGTTRNSCL